MTKYRWIKIKDVLGEIYEFEECNVSERPGTIIIFFVAPIGIVKKQFVKKNLVSFEYLIERK